MTEQDLLAQTGSHSENPTMSVASRYVFDHCQKPVELIGPVEELVAEIIALQQAFWQNKSLLTIEKGKQQSFPFL